MGGNKVTYFDIGNHNTVFLFLDFSFRAQKCGTRLQVSVGVFIPLISPSFFYLPRDFILPRLRRYDLFSRFFFIHIKIIILIKGDIDPTCINKWRLERT